MGSIERVFATQLTPFGSVAHVRPPGTVRGFMLDQSGSLRAVRLVRRISTLLFCLGLPVNVLAAPTVAPKPNILFILADDLGYGDLSCQNPNSKIRTPRLDGLASQGMAFSSAHAPSALCTPSRYSILCGQYCWRSRLKSGVLHSWDEPVIPRERLTVAGLLRQQGYSTGCFGKWHLGLSWPFVGVVPPGFDTSVKASDINWNRRIGGGPIDHGFDFFFGINIANEPPYAYIRNDRVVGTPSAQFETVTGLQSHWAGPGVADWHWSQVLPTVVSNAVGWIGQSATQNSNRPFFLYLALPGPHQPIVPTAQFAGTSSAGLYGDYVQELDWAVGQILDKLEASGAATNTLVIFTSDNGPDEFAYERFQQYGHSSMGALRGIKNDLWEGGHRVPFLARWPGKVTVGSTSSQVICLVDFMRTVADLVEAPLPTDAGEDSVSFLPALLGAKMPGARSSLILESGQAQFGIWTNDWMFIDSSTGDGHDPELEPLWFKQRRGYPATNIYPALLYDLAHDLPECTNLYSRDLVLSAQLQAELHHQRGLQCWDGVLSGSWTNCANWSEKSWPAGFDLVYSNIISGAYFTQVLETNFSINSLSLLDVTQRVTLQPGGPFSLTIANGIDLSLASSDLMLQTPVCLAQSQVWTVSSNRSLTAAGPVCLNGSDLMVCGRGNVIFTDSLSGSGRVIIRGSGFVLLGGGNTYSGGTELSGGAFLVAQHPSALGTGSLEIPNNSTLQIEPGVGLSNSMTIQGLGAIFQNIPRGAITTYHPGNAEVRGSVMLQADAGVYAHQAGSVLTFSGPIDGHANLTIMPGTGTVVFAANNLYAGSTFVQGKLMLTGGSDRVPAETRVFLADSSIASLELDGITQTVRQLSGGGASGGNIFLSGGSLIINQDCASTYAGSFSGSGDLIKTNAGTLELTGTCSYSGTTRVSGGGLLLNGTLRNSTVLVNGGILGGTGLITGPVTIQASGNLSPGPGLGALTISNSLTLAKDSTTFIQVDPVQGMASRVEGLSQVTYGGTLLVNNLAPAASLQAGESFRVFCASAATGRFSAILPAPAPGLAWNFDPAAGMLSVVAQPTIRASLTDAHHLLVLWPGRGFHLQAQTNSLSPQAAKWFDYPSAGTSPVVVPIDPNSPAIFLRLVTP